MTPLVHPQHVEPVQKWQKEELLCIVLAVDIAESIFINLQNKYYAVHLCIMLSF
jgi:hypothetical protein